MAQDFAPRQGAVKTRQGIKAAPRQQPAPPESLAFWPPRDLKGGLGVKLLPLQSR